MRISKSFRNFFQSERAGGIILIAATVISLLLANSNFSESYVKFWNRPLANHSLTHWINDGLMAIFFLLIGLELKREIFVGELRNLKTASLPIFGALGGMLVPAAIFAMFNIGSDDIAGAGIPMATDIAFAVGILSLLGSRVPTSLKIFLTALAVIDDLGAILVIAIFYTKTISFLNLFAALGSWLVLLVLNRLKIRNLIPYLIGGVAMWYFMLHSGVHATITGVLLAFAIPFGDGSEKSPSHLLQHLLHKPVAFVVLPLFALANTCIAIGGWQNQLTDMLGIGIILGLVIGKPLGIFYMSYGSARFGFCSLPDGLRWREILSVGFLGGIGFTMSIFIALLAFDDAQRIDQSKIAILAASLIAGVLGFAFLRLNLRQNR